MRRIAVTRMTNVKIDNCKKHCVDFAASCIFCVELCMAVMTSFSSNFSVQRSSHQIGDVVGFCLQRNTTYFVSSVCCHHTLILNWINPPTLKIISIGAKTYHHSSYKLTTYSVWFGRGRTVSLQPCGCRGLACVLLFVSQFDMIFMIFIVQKPFLM